MSSTRKIEVALVGDAASLERTLKKTGKSLDDLGKHTKGVKSIVKAAAGLVIFQKVEEGLKEVTKAAIDNEAGLRRDGIAVKNAGENWKKLKAPIDEALTKMSVTSGFLKRDLQNAFSSAELATNNHTTALKLTSEAMNVSAQTGKPLKTVTLALGKAWQGNAVALRRLGIFTPVVTKAQDLLRAAHDKLIKSGKKLSTSQTVDYNNAVRAAKASDKQASAQSSLDAVHKKFANAVADRSKTMAGQLLILDAKWDEMKVKVGEQVIPLITAAFGPLLSVMDRLSHLSGSTKTALELAGAALLGVAFGVKAVELAMKAAEPIIALFDAEMDANPIGLVVIAIAALAAALVVLYTKNKAFHDAVDNTWTWIKQNIPPIIQQIANVLRSVWGAIGPYVMQLWDSIKGQVKAALDLIKGYINLFGDVIHGRWGKIWGDLKAIASAGLALVWAYLKGAPRILAELLGKAALAGLNAFLGEYYKLPGQLWDIVSGAIGYVVGNIPSALDGLKSAGSWILGAVVDGVQGLPSALGSVFDNALGWIKKKLESFHVSIKTKTMLGVPIPTGFSIGFGSGGDTGSGVTLPAVNLTGSVGSGGLASPKISTKNAVSFLNGNLPKGDGSDAPYVPPKYTFPTGGDPTAGAADKASSAADKLKAKLQALADKSAAVRDAIISKLDDAFGKVGDFALKAFDGKTQQGLQNFADGAAKASKTIADDLNAKLKSIGDAQSADTPAEAALKALQSAHDQAGRDSNAAKGQADLAAANYGLNADGSTMTPEDQAAAQAAAQKEIDDAAYEQRVYDLGVQAAGERVIADQKAKDDAQAANDKATADQKVVDDKLAKDQLNYQSSRDLQRGALEDQLADFKNIIDQHPGLWKKVHTKVMKLFSDDFGPDFTTAGLNIGDAYIKGLGQAFAGVGPLVAPAAKAVTKASGDAKKAGKHAMGGVYDTATLGWFGEDGAEAIVPLTKPARAAQVMREAGLGGGPNITQNIYLAPDTPVQQAASILSYKLRQAVG